MRIAPARRALVLGALILSLHPLNASAQPLGSFRWQLQPYCNTLTLAVTQTGGIFTLDGVDDLCGDTAKAAAVGIASPRPDGTVGLGLTLVLASGATPLHLTATIDMSSISGSWQDSAGNSGALIFNPAISPGSPRPLPKTVFPAGLSAGDTTIINVAPPVNDTDAANKSYVDQKVGAASYWLNIRGNATIRSTSQAMNGATVVRAPGYPIGFYCIRYPSGLSIQREAAVGSVQQTSGGDGQPFRMTVTTTFGSACNPTNFDVAVQTYNAAGALADLSFVLFVPQ
jgi:hypothetical protein